jgi:hypothetical protein
MDRVRQKIITASAVVLIAGLIAGLIVSRWDSHMFPAPVLVPMSIARSNAAFAVYPGNGGARFIMPDGSLWQWGEGVTNANGLPELFNDQHHWAKVFNRTDQWLAQDTDGHVWEGRRWQSRLVPLGAPLPGTNQDWAELTGGVMYTLGLQRDGTILGWEMSYGATGKTNPITEVATNLLWRAISAYGPNCIGVSSDGRLWTWQRQGFAPLTFTQPMLASTNTHWIGVDDGEYAWSSSGELCGKWGIPIDRLESKNAIKGRFAVGAMVHEIRSDGTLWAIGSPGPPVSRPIARRGSSSGGSIISYGRYFVHYGNGVAPHSGNLPWRKIGNRSDWISIWGSDETYFGLTGDGTVWVWGTDWGQQPVETWKDKLANLWEDIRDRFQPSAGVPGRMAGRPAAMATLPYQADPRPLMRFNSVTNL